MAISHVKSNTAGDWTGTVTVGNSTGGTQTMAATDLVRPGDWNSAHNQFFTLTGNTTGASTASGTNVMFAASGNIRLGGSTGTIVISDPVMSGFNPYQNFMQAIPPSLGNGSLWLNPVDVQRAFQYDRAAYLVSYTQGAVALTVTVSAHWGLYSRNANTLSLYKSGSGSLSINGQIASVNMHDGVRLLTFASTDTVTAGNYVLGMMSRTSTAGANSATLINVAISQHATSISGMMGVLSNGTAYRAPGQGVFTASTAAMPASVAYSEIIGQSSQFNRQPILYFTSGAFP